MVTCRTCGDLYQEFGDGWDGECPSCADKSFLRDELATEEEAVEPIDEGQISFHVGDLLTSDETVIAHGCNCRGAMGAGIAAQVARRWPNVRNVYAVACASGDFFPGSAQLVSAIEPNGNLRWVFNLGTQLNPGAEARIEYVRVAFSNMLDVCLGANFSRVAIPRIGCGIGGLHWDEVERVIREVIDLNDLHIAVYDLEASS